MRLLATFFLLLCCSFASAQSNLSELKARVVHQPLFLRGLWAGDKLEFDAAGVPHDPQ